jgi:kynureninase
MCPTTRDPTTSARIDAAIAALGPLSLSGDGVAAHVAPLFSRVLARDAQRVYLANHSLGRPLDAMEDDVREALAAWYARLGDAWDDWSAELVAHRERIARLIGAVRAGCVIPKTSAGAGLRAVLNALPARSHVLATRGEFDSIDVILREYARRDRIRLTFVESDEDDRFGDDAIASAIVAGVDLVVVSQVMFRTGQCVDAAAIVKRAHDVGAKVVLDVYHAVGVLPVDVSSLNADFAIGGSYKYLRGGPGACYLYVAPHLLDAGLTTPDIGWFAKEAPFSYQRPDPPRFASGGDGWMESTPPVLTWYQARAGQRFTLAIGVERLRAYSLTCQRFLAGRLRDDGFDVRGGDERHGAFVTVRHADASRLAEALDAQGIDVDARGEWLRLCPDVLTRVAELERAIRALRSAARA